MLRRLPSLLAALVALAAAAAPVPCDTVAHHAFDFWIGDWDVYTPTGKLAGTNKITRELGGCVVHEHYATPQGFSGESLNIYDAGRKVWHQSWVDSSGSLLVIEGQPFEHGMKLEGAIGEDGKPTPQRITWTANADGTVRQLWEQANTDGTWKVAFDGLYKRHTP